MRVVVRVATVVTVCLFIGVAAGRAATTLTTLAAPVADTYVSALQPTENFGAADSLQVSARPFSAAYLRFTVNVPPGETVTKATLQLYASVQSTAGFTVHRVTRGAWGERSISYANVPPTERGVVASSGPYRGNRYVSVDVTRLITHSGVVSLALKGTSAAPLLFKSREAPAGRPRLLVEAGSAGAGGTTPCGTMTGPARGIDHVIWIWMENKSYDDVVGSSSAPFENKLAGQCGVATNYHAITHPSLPNYIAATSGGTQGILDDEAPSSHPLEAASLYSQLEGAGKQWRDYAESAPGPCPLASSGTYAVKHDPAAYYSSIRSRCAAWDVPMGTTSSGSFISDLTNGTLPAFSFVAPDLNNDTHDTPVATGDAWLQTWLSKIVTSPTYRAGRTAVFVVWDEDDDSSSNQVPLIVVSPWTAAGTQPAAYFDHYSLLKTTEQLLGLLAFLGHAGDPGTASMLSSFNLG